MIVDLCIFWNKGHLLSCPGQLKTVKGKWYTAALRLFGSQAIEIDLCSSNDYSLEFQKMQMVKKSEQSRWLRCWWVGNTQWVGNGKIKKSAHYHLFSILWLIYNIKMQKCCKPKSGFEIQILELFCLQGSEDFGWPWVLSPQKQSKKK